MSHSRNLKYLNQNRIVYRSDPKNDKPTEVYTWGYYFEEGTYECYTLFASKAKITSYKSLKWHLLVLWYLNPQLDYNKFVNISNFIADKSNGFITVFTDCSWMCWCRTTGRRRPVGAPPLRQA